MWQKEALEAVKGGAHIVDVEFPASALGTPYPLNIMTVRRNVPPEVLVSTNIGEEQLSRSTACQAAIGVAVAGADIIKAGLAKMSFKETAYLGRNIVRTIRTFCPNKQIIPVIFADPDLVEEFINPVEVGAALAAQIRADGILIDTFDKSLRKGLCDYMILKQIKTFVRRCHDKGLEAWIAGSITLEQLPSLWRTGVDVVCVRGAACESTKTKGRFGPVKAKTVAELVKTLPQMSR